MCPLIVSRKSPCCIRPSSNGGLYHCRISPVPILFYLGMRTPPQWGHLSVTVRFDAQWIFCCGSISPVLDSFYRPVLGGIRSSAGNTGNKKFQADQRAAAPGTVLPRIFSRTDFPVIIRLSVRASVVGYLTASWCCYTWNPTPWTPIQRGGWSKKSSLDGFFLCSFWIIAWYWFGT